MSKTPRNMATGAGTVKKKLLGGVLITISIPLSIDSIIVITVWNTKETMNFKFVLYVET